MPDTTLPDSNIECVAALYEGPFVDGVEKSQGRLVVKARKSYVAPKG